MKQILSLWDACPQGGKHRRSVFLRLLLLVCMLATASAGWADQATWTSANQSSLPTSLDDGNITLDWATDGNTNHTALYGNGSSKVVRFFSDGNKIVIGSTSDYKITSIVITISNKSNSPAGFTTLSSGTWSTFNTSGQNTFTVTTPTAEATYEISIYKSSGTLTNGRIDISGITVNYEAVGGGSDTTPPTLSSSTPANNATGVATSGNITLTFSENVTIKDASKFTLTTTGAGSLTTANISASGAVVTIPYTGFDNSTSYTLNTAAGAVEDAANNESAALSDITFTTVAAAIEPTATFNNGSYTIGGSALDLSTLWASNSSGAVTYTVTNANGTGATIAGTSFTATTAGTATVQASQAADGAYSATTKTATITVSAAAAKMITYNLNVGTSASTTLKSSVTTEDPTNITNIDIVQTYDGANGAGASNRTTKLAIKTGANGADWSGDPTNYELFKFTVAAGKQFTPSEIAIKVANVGSSSANDIKYKAVLSDESGHSINGTFVATKQDGTVEDFTFTNSGNVAFVGNVTLKLWAWQIASSNASAFRMGTPLTIDGTVTNAPTVAPTFITQPVAATVRAVASAPCV